MPDAEHSQTFPTSEKLVVEDILPMVYDELRRLANHQMPSQPPGQTLQATALVHEAYLRLTGDRAFEWNGRSHFFRAAAEAMRHILIDRARGKKRQKRGGKDLRRVDLQDLDLAVEAEPETLLLVNEALQTLAREDKQKADLVELRFFIGLTNGEAAKVLNISEATVKRHWSFARAFLLVEIQRLLGHRSEEPE